jgi:nucleolar MIF4G domain-containing protein 1
VFLEVLLISSVRTKFMIETIINLKNNRAKGTTATSVVNSEATIRMKKFLGKLGEKNLRSGGEPLRVTLDDIRNVNEKGKWWLIGASWKNDELNLQPEPLNEQTEDKLLSLAREQRMNTDIRRAVFIALMGSEVSFLIYPSNSNDIGLYRRVYTYPTVTVEKGTTN